MNGTKKEYVAEKMMWHMGEYNDAITRKQLTHELANMLYEPRYVVVCDESNNPPKTIDQNLLIVDIFEPRFDLTTSFTLKNGAITFDEVAKGENI